MSSAAAVWPVTALNFSAAKLSRTLSTCSPPHVVIFLFTIFDLNRGCCPVKLLLILTIVLVTSSLLQADCASTPNQWCQTYPGTVTLPATPPFGRSWNHLVWDPDTHKAMI